MTTPDWNKPQRQPLSGLAIVFVQTLWEILKRLWPFVLLALLGGNPDKVNRYEVMAIGVFGVTIISAILQFIYFRFFIEDERLIIKKGWLKKETKVIPLEKIQTVHIEQGPMHQLLGIVKLSIDTAGAQKAEASIDALHRSMAEALRLKLISGSKVAVEELEDPQLKSLPPSLFRLSGRDLFRLSISANHVEAFFLLLSFGIGMYQNLSQVDDNFFSRILDFLPEHTFYPMLFLVVFILFITVLVSSARIFFRFYDFRVYHTDRGFHIRSGLTHIRERLITTSKIQMISWKQSWLRRLFSMWMLEYHVAAGDELNARRRVQLPITRDAYIPLLASGYHPVPGSDDKIFLAIHPSYVMRRLLVAGILPMLLIIPMVWWLWSSYAMMLLLYPVAVGISAALSRRKFRLWADGDVLYIKKGVFGEERILMRWNKLQSAELRQSPYQRRHQLATVVMRTAAGPIRIPFVPLPSARALVNFSLYQVESRNEAWM